MRNVGRNIHYSLPIFDEVTAFLSSDSVEKIPGFINNHFRGKTIIIITHKSEILRSCTKTVRLNSKN